MSLIVELGTEDSIGAKIRAKRDSKKEITRKVRTKAPTTLQKIFRCRNEPNSQYYLTKALSVHPSNARDVLTEASPFRHPEDKELTAFRALDRQRRHLRPAVPLGGPVSDVLRRLYVEEPKATGPPTVLDIDQEYFHVVSGRPILAQFRMGKYMQDIRDVLRTKLMTGYRKDEMVNIDFQIRDEQRAIDDMAGRLRACVDGFEQFLSEDYDMSLARLRKADQVSAESGQLADRIRELYVELGDYEFTVYKLEERWRDLTMYQNFLYCVSPLSWRVEHDHLHRTDVEGELEPDPSRMFRKYRLDSQGEIPPLEVLVDEYLETVAKNETPQLYFTDPAQLGKVFRYMEIQNLNSLLHTDDITIPLEQMRETLKAAKKSFKEEAECINYMINSLTVGIEWEEQCVCNLRDMAMSLIENQLRTLVSDDEILKMHVYVEDVFTACIAPNESNLGLHEMMMGVEQQYHKLSLQMEDTPPSILEKSIRFQFVETARLNKLYKETAKKIALVDKITRRLKKSMEPPLMKIQRDLVFRSVPPERREVKAVTRRELTEDESDYLTFFTEYCEHRDVVEKFGVNLNVSEAAAKNEMMRATLPSLNK